MRFATLALLVLAITAHSVTAKFLTDKEVESATCHSSIQQTEQRVTVSNPPTSAIDILRYPGSVGSFTLNCMQIFESLTNSDTATATQIKSCASSNPTLSICIAAADDTVSDANAAWSCTSLSQYLATPVTTTSYNPPAGASKMRIKFQWLPQLTTAACYPRDLTVLIVGAEPNAQGASVAASVIFIIIVIAVGLGVAGFAMYQVRKSMSHFKRGEFTDDVPHDLTPNEVKKRDDDVDADASMNQFDDVYVDQTAYAVTDEGEVLESRALPKPWYQRHNYDLNSQKKVESIARDPHDSRRLDFGSPGERAPPPPVQQLSATRRRTTPQNPVPAQPAAAAGRWHYDDRSASRPSFHTGLHVDGTNSLRDYDGTAGYSDEDEEAEVLVCGDCGLEIHHKMTPQLCSQTGKRHY